MIGDEGVQPPTPQGDSHAPQPQSDLAHRVAASGNDQGVDSVNQDIIQKLFNQLKSNPLMFGMYYFPHHFRIPSPPFHLQILKEACIQQYLAVAAPRESAKSTILTFIYPFHCVVFKKNRFIVIVSNTFKKAAMYLDTIKKELIENDHFKKEFRNSIRITKDAEGDSIITHRDGFSTKIICKGHDQLGSIRGVKYGAYRPDLIICDDIEDDKMVENAELRAELQRQYDESLVPAGEKGKCQFIVVGTILHDDSQMAKLVSSRFYPEYKKLYYRALMHNGKSLWPEKWSVDYLLKLQKEKPSVFAKEYQNDPVSGANVRFKREDFRYWKVEDGQYILFGQGSTVVGRGRLADCRAAIAVDLAWSEKRDADSSIIMPGFLTPTGETLVETYVNKRGLRPDEFAEFLFTIEDRLRRITGQTVPVGMEKAMLENVTKWVLKNEMKRRNHYLVVKELAWDADKIKRIETRLIPLYNQNVIFHKYGMGDLEFQLIRFPSGVHDDLPDALQGLRQLLQFPKNIPKQQEIESEFDRVRRIMIEKKYEKPEKPKLTGRKYKHWELPHHSSFR